ELVAAANGRIARSAPLLAAELERQPVAKALAVECAIEIRTLVAGFHVDAGTGRRTTDRPAAQVHTELIRATFHGHILERPELRFGHVEYAPGTLIQRLQLHAIEKHANPARITQIRRVLWRREPARAKDRDARDRGEQVQEIIRARGEDRVAVPVILAAHPKEQRALRVREWCLDRVSGHLGRVPGGIRRERNRRTPRRVSARAGGIAREARGVARGLLGLREGGRQQRQRGDPLPITPGTEPSDVQVTLPRANSTNVPTGTPVGPFGR